MLLGKNNNGVIALTEVEDGKELSRPFRKESTLYAAGWKKACPVPRPSELATGSWREYPSCFVQEWTEPIPIIEQ